MRLEVNGIQYENFTEAECEIRLDALSGSFSFSAAAPGGAILPIKGGDECKIIIDNETVLVGDVEVIEIGYDADNHDIMIQGRSRGARLLDSTLGQMDDIAADGLTLKKVIESVAEHLGLSIIVHDESDIEPFNLAEDLAAPEPGDNAFQFIEKYSRKRQVLLHPAPDGGIIIAKNSGILADGIIQHILGADDNNVIAGSFRYDATGRYNVYKFASQLNPVPLNSAGGSDLASLVAQGGGALDPDISSGRQLVLVPEAPYSDEECNNRAKWEADIRKARGMVYDATVPLFREGGETGNLWAVNRIYSIVDDFVGKIEPMLCNSVTYRMSEDEGRTTKLGFVGRNAYTLVLDDPSDSEVANVAT